MRHVLVLLLLLGCNSGEGETSMASATTTVSTSAATPATTAPTTGGGCMGHLDCMDGQMCSNGTCVVPECEHTDDCDETEFCDQYVCAPRHAIGEPCREEDGEFLAAPERCLGGVCGKVNGKYTCVAGCEWGECHENILLNSPLCGEEQTYESCEPPCQFVGRPRFVGCDEGFLCVGPYVDVVGSKNSHYCWPAEASDYPGPGTPCALPNQQDDACVTNYCGFDSTCRWRCEPMHPNRFCPNGMTCVDAQPPAGFYECQ